MILFFITKAWKRESRKYGCPSNGSRKRQVYCTIDDALSSIRDSGLVGTCYDDEMAVGSDHSALTRNTETENRTTPMHGCSRTDKRLFKWRDRAGARRRTVPSALERIRTLPTRPVRSRTGPSALPSCLKLAETHEKSAREKCTSIHIADLFAISFILIFLKRIWHQSWFYIKTMKSGNYTCDELCTITASETSLMKAIFFNLYRCVI